MPLNFKSISRKNMTASPGIDTQLAKIYVLRFLFSASNFVMPFATLFVAKYYDFSSAIQGYVVMGFSASYLIGSLMGGYLGDKISTRPLLISLASVLLGSMLASTFLATPLLNVVALTMSTLAAGASVPVLNTYIAAVVDRSAQQSVFGNLYLTYNLAIAFVYIAGGFMLDKNAGFALELFTFMACLTVLATLTLNGSRAIKDASGSASTSPSIRIPTLVILGFCLFAGLAVLDAQRSYLLPKWLDAINATSAAKTFGILGIVNACTVLVATKPLISYVKKFSPITNMAIAAIFYGIGFGGYFFVHDLPAMCILVVVWTAGEILGATYMNVIIAENVPGAIRSRVFSIIPSLLTVGKIIAIEFAQVMINTAGVTRSWIFYNTIAILIFFGAVYVRRSLIVK